MTLTAPIIAFILFGVFGTSILSGILGMAGGMVLMGVLAWVLPVQQAMILHAVSQFFANGSRALIHRRHIYTKTLPYYFLGLALMLGVFVFVSLVPDKLTVFLLLGVTPFLAFLLPKNAQLDFTRPWQALACGLLVTGFQLTGGVSGPLLDIFFQTRALTRHQTVATKAFTQSISHITKFVYFAFVVSSFSHATAGLPLWLCAAVVPVAMTGTHISKYILERLSDKQFFKATQAALFTVGAVYIVKALLLWLENGQGG
ncbi:MAG TPA: sulfite exporter TauE/SafE family protein [Patescibacteria group bacterium]|nr:sulfite exporter TauE/SafE family protein [Patescibacteria group bacterium]